MTKTYVDFEYYIDNNVDIKDQYIGHIFFLKILHYIQSCFGGINFENNNSIHTALQRFYD